MDPETFAKILEAALAGQLNTIQRYGDAAIPRNQITLHGVGQVSSSEPYVAAQKAALGGNFRSLGPLPAETERKIKEATQQAVHLNAKELGDPQRGGRVGDVLSEEEKKARANKFFSAMFADGMAPPLWNYGGEFKAPAPPGISPEIGVPQMTLRGALEDFLFSNKGLR